MCHRGRPGPSCEVHVLLGGSEVLCWWAIHSRPWAQSLPCLPDRPLQQLLERLDWHYLHSSFVIDFFAFLFFCFLLTCLSQVFVTVLEGFISDWKVPLSAFFYVSLFLEGVLFSFLEGVRKQEGFLPKILSASLWVLLRYWVRFQRNCFILWAISTFLKFRHLSDPVLQIPLKCFCQDGLSVLDHILPAAQASSVEKTLRHMVQMLAFLSE